MTLKASEDIIDVRRNEIRANKKGASFVRVYGLDTETYKGKPMTLQFSDGKKDHIFFVNQKNITKKFLTLLSNLPSPKHEKSIIYVLNLLFDFCQCFYPHWKTLIEQEKKDGQFDFKISGWNIKGFITEDSQFAEIAKGKKVFWLVDIGRFFIGISLDRAIKTLLHEKGKESPPKKLGNKMFTKNDKKFVKYALWDVHQTQRIGKVITEFHNKWDIIQTWSIAQMAERIFRHHFLKENIKGCPYEIIRPALYSYHGGRNAFYNRPNLFKRCYSYDLVSAYSFAMVNLPNFQGCEYYRVKKYEPKFCGIYKISGFKKTCKYPAFFANHFKEIKGKFEDVWITSFELKQALKYKEVKIDKIEGYIVYPKNKEVTALQKYVEAFVKLKKETPKDEVYYEFYKRLLNALYGKFIQMREVKIDADNKKWITGQMFQPFIASLITGYVRAMIHDLEHKFKSIHTSTDSIKTLKPIPEKYLSKELGGLSLEVKGKCLILRNRLYLHFKGNKIDFSKDKKGEYIHLKKYALHGFKGKPEGLFKIWKEGKRVYIANRMIKPKEAIVQGKNPFVFEDQKRSLNF